MRTGHDVYELCKCFFGRGILNQEGESPSFIKNKHMKLVVIIEIKVYNKIGGENMKDINLIRRKDVCKIYNKTYRTVINWEKKGLIKAIRINGGVYYELEKILRLSKGSD